MDIKLGRLACSISTGLIRMIDTTTIKLIFAYTVILLAGALHASMANAQTVALTFETATEHARDTNGNLLLSEGTITPLPPDIDTSGSMQIDMRTILQMQMEGLVHSNQMRLTLNSFDWFVLRVSIIDRKAGLVSVTRPNFGTAPHARIDIEPIETSTSRALLIPDFNLSRPAAPASSSDLEHAVYSIFVGGRAISVDDVAGLVPDTCFDPTSTNQNIYTGDINEMSSAILTTTGALSTTITITSANNNRDFHGDQIFTASVTLPCSSITLMNLPPKTFIPLPEPITYRMRDDDVPYVAMNGERLLAEGAFLDPDDISNTVSHINSEGDTFTAPIRLVRGKADQVVIGGADEFLIDQPNYSSAPLMLYLGINSRFSPGFRTLEIGEDFRVLDRFSQPLDVAIGPIRDHANNNNPLLNIAADFNRYFLVRVDPGMARLVAAQFEILEDDVYEVLGDDPLSPTAYQPQERLQIGLIGVARDSDDEHSFSAQTITVYDYPRLPNAEGYIVNRGVSETVGRSRGALDHYSVDLRTNNTTTMHISLVAIPSTFIPGATIRIGYSLSAHVATRLPFLNMSLGDIGNPNQLAEHITPCSPTSGVLPCQTEVFSDPPVLGGNVAVRINSDAIPNQFIEVAHFIIAEDAPLRDFAGVFMNWDFRMRTLDDNLSLGAISVPTQPAPSYTDLYSLVQISGASLTRAGAVIAVPSGQSVPSVLTETHVRPVIFEPNPADHCAGNNPITTTLIGERDLCVRPEESWDIYGVLLNPVTNSLRVVENTGTSTLALPFNLLPDIDYAWEPNPAVLSDQNGAATPTFAPGESSKYLGTLSMLADSYIEQDEVIQLKVGVIRGVTQFVPQGNIVVLDYFADAFETLGLPGSVLPDVFAQGAAMTILDSDRRFYSLLSLQQMDGTFEFVDVPARVTESALPLDIIRFRTATFFRWGGDTLELNDVFGSAVTTLSTTLGAALILPNLPPPISGSTDLGEDFRNQDDTSIASLRSVSFDTGRAILSRYGFDSNAVPAGTRASYTFNKNFVFTPDADEAPGIAPLVIQLAEPPVGMGGTNDPTFALPVRFLSDAQIAANEFATLLPPEYASVGALNASTPIIGVVNSTATYRFQASSDMTMLLQFVLAHPSNPLPTDISTLALTLKRGDTTLGHAHVLQTVDITSLASKLYIGFAGQTRSLRDGGAGLQGVQCNNDALRSNPELVSADDNAYFIQAIHDGDRGDLSEYTLEIEIPPSASAYFGENASWLEIRSEIACVQGPVEDNPVSTDDIVYANFHSVPCTASTEGLADPAVCALATQQLRYTDDDFLISAIEASDVTLDGSTVLGIPVPAVLTEHPTISELTGHLRGIRLTLDPPYVSKEPDPGTLPRITLLFTPSGIAAKRVLVNPHADDISATIIGASPPPITGVALSVISDDNNDVVVASAVFSLAPDNIYDPDAVLEIAIPPVTDHHDARTVSLDLLIADKNNHIIGAPCQNAYLHDTVCPPITAVETTSSGIINLQYGGIMREDTITRLRIEWEPPSVGSLNLLPLNHSAFLPVQTLANGKRSLTIEALLGETTDRGPLLVVVPDNLEEGEMFVVEMELSIDDPPLALPSDDSYARGLGLNTTSTVVVTGHPANVFPNTYTNIGPTEPNAIGDEGQSARYTLRAAAGVSIAMRMNGTWHEDAQISISSEDAIASFNSVQLTGADLMAATDNVVYMTFYDDRLAEADAPATCTGINQNNQLVIPHADTADDVLSEYTIEISIPEDEDDHYYDTRRAYSITHVIACTSLSPGNLPSAINLDCETTLPTPAHCTLGPSDNSNREVVIDYRDNDGYIDALVLRDAINLNTANDLEAFFEIGSNTENMMLPERVVLLASLPGTNLSGRPLNLPVSVRDLSAIAERTIMHGASLVPKDAPLSIDLQIDSGQSTAISDVFTAPANTGYQPQTPMSVTYPGIAGTASREFIVRDAADNFIGFSDSVFQREFKNVRRGKIYPIVFRLHKPAIEDVNLMVRFTLDHPSQTNLNRMENLVRGPDTPQDGAFTSQTHIDGSTLYEIVVAYSAGNSEAHVLNLSYPDSVYEFLQTANIDQSSVLLTGLSTSASDTLDGTRFVASRSVSLATRPDLPLFVGMSVPSIVGFLPGDVEDTNRPNFNNYPSVFDDHTVIGHDNAIPFALSVLASDQLGDIDLGINQTGVDITVRWEARLLLDGEEVEFNNPARSNPYPDYLVLLDADGNEQAVFSASGARITTLIPAGQSTATFAWAIRNTPTRTLELDQLSVRLRITGVEADKGSSFASTRADALRLSYTLRDTTQLPLGFEFISTTSGEDGSIPTTQGQYADILPNLNNLAMFNAEHTLPEGVIIQFRPRLEDDGVAAPYRVVGRAGKFIDIPLLFEAGTHTPRFGGAFVALRNMDAIQIDTAVRDNRCRLLEARDATNDIININHTVDYCLQQRGLASANARRTLDSEPLLGNTTGTSTLLADDASGVSQLSLRLVAGIALNTVATANNPADDPFTHLLMGMVIAAPHLPTTLDEAISEVVPATQANYDLTLEPDEHFVMRWSTTDTRIAEADSNQRRFIIRGHSPQNVLSYSERFAQAEFGLSEPSTDALRYIPHYQTQILAVPESQTLTLALSLVGDTPTDIPTASNARANQALYYTDTVAREFSLRLTTVTNTIAAALPQSLQIGNAVLPATATPTPLQLQFTITGLEDLNAINEQYGFELREVTANLPSDISDSARLILSNTGIPLSLLSEDDDLPPAINLSYRLFDLGDNPYTNTAGTLTQDTLDGYRVQGSAAIVPVARDSANQNLLDTAAMPRFPDSLSRYRFGVDFPEHDLSVRAPPALGTIVGRGAYLAELDNQPIDLAPHFELYAVFITPEADAFNYLTRNGGSPRPDASQTLSLAGLAHPHNLDASETTISAAPVGTRQARSLSQLSPQLRAILPNNAEHIMLFARLSHHPDDLDTSLVLARVAEHCPVIADTDTDTGALGADGNIIVSINDHRHATGSEDKLAQPFSILNILGIDDSDNAALYQYGYRENIATMNIALLCASDPSLSPDLNDNLKADNSAGPEYCATRMNGSYCQVGAWDLNYTDYLPELYNPDLVQGGASFYMHRAHNAPLYEADATAGISVGYEGAGTPTNCQNADADPAQRCNQLSWLIQVEPRLQVGFYDEHSRSELLRHTPRVNTQADDTRLQWAITTTATHPAIIGDLTATQLTRAISTGGNQDVFDNPDSSPANLPTELADSLTLLTAALPSNVNTFADLSFATQINANDQYRHCALLFTSADAVQACANQNIQPQQLRFEPSLITRVYDGQNRPSVISHPVIADTSTATITIADPDVYVLLQTTAGDGTLQEGSVGEDGSFVELSARFGGISDTNMADRLDLALIFYTDTDTALQLHAETSNTNTAIPFFAGVANPAKAGSDLVVQARGNTLPYGGLWSDPEMNIGSADANPLTLTLFADEAGLLLESSSVTSSVDLNDEATINAHPILGTNRVLLALRYPAIAPSDQPQLLARVYVNMDNDTTDGARSLRVALGVLGASEDTDITASDLDYLQSTDLEGNTLRVNTAESIGATYLPNYLGLQEANAMAFATPVTQQLIFADDETATPSIVGFLPGDLNDPARPNSDNYPSVFDDHTVIGSDNAIPFALSVLASDQLGNIDVGINQTGLDITVSWEARLLLDGEQVTFNRLTQPNPYPDYLVLLDADGNEQAVFSASGARITTVIPAGQSTATFAWAIRDDPSITPARTLELDQLSVLLRITGVEAGKGSSSASIRADALRLSYTLRDTTELPLGFEFISATSGEDGRIPTTQGQYADILPNLNNLAMFNAEHGLPEGALIQFRPRLEDDGNAAPYRVHGRVDKFIDIPLLFEAGTHTPRFGGAFVALRNMDAIQIDTAVRDNRCRLLEARDAANDAININHTVDYCLQQRGLASANARRTLDSEPLLGDTTGTSTVLDTDANGVSQLSLRLATGTTLNTVATANNPADDPFTHLLMGMVIAAPHLPTTLDEAISEVVPATQANYDLTLEPDEHFVMRWSTTGTRITSGDNHQRRFIIRGHSPQSVLSYSERFARAEFGLSEPSTDALRYIPHFELAPPLHQSVLTVVAVPESQSIMVTLRWVGDTPMDIDARDDALHDAPLYYTDTIPREFALDIDLTSSVNTIDAALPQSLQIGNATLPATATPAPLQLQFTITGLEDLNAINEQFLVMLARVREVTPSLPGSISQTARTTVSTSTLSLNLVKEDDDLPPAINLSYRLFDLDANPYTNTAGALTQNTLDGYRVQGSAAIVPVARDSANQNLLDTATMPRFPDSLSRYRFGVDFPEHNRSLPVPPDLGTIVGRGAYLAELDNQPIDLAPHFELYAVFITPEADAFNYLTRNGGSPRPDASQTLSLAGLAHPHNLAQTSTAIISAAPVGTRQARSLSQLSPQLRAILPNNAEHIMLFARLSHHPDDLDTSLVLARVAEHCPVIENAGADATALGADGNIIVSINDHRHATGSEDKLAQPFSILNILGIDNSDTAALYQYGYRENIATMNIALLCASDPSLSPNLNDNLKADNSAGPEYCATRMVDGYCQVGTYDLNYTDYLPELYNPDLVQGGASFNMHRAHNGALYEADATAGISVGYEGAGTPTNCQNADADSAQRCNQLSWLIQVEPRLQVGFYDEHSRSELLRHTHRVNTQADDTRLQWAITTTATHPAIIGDLTATQLTRAISTGGNQDVFDNPDSSPANLPIELADSLTLLTAALPYNGNAIADLAFATQINANDQYRHCALLFTSADAVQACANQNIQPQQLRFEPSLITRVYDAQNRPSVISHPVIADTSTATITIADPDVYVLLESGSSDNVLDEANPGENGSFVELSARFGGISDTNMADRLDLALIFYTDTDTALQLHAETSNTNTAIPFFAGVTNPAKASSDIVVQARGETAPYGGLWSAPEMNLGSVATNPLILTLFADEAGRLLDRSNVISPVNLNNQGQINAHPMLGTNRVLLALRYPAIKPSTQSQLLARVYVNMDNDTTDGARSLRVALGVLGASEDTDITASALGYLQSTDLEGNTLRVNTAESIVTTYLPNYLGLRAANAMAFAAPVTQQLRLLDDDTVVTGISIINTPSSSNILVEQDIVSAVHQLHLSNLNVPYLDGADTLITPTNVGVLLRLDFSVPNDARVSPNNMFSVRLRDTDNSNNDADTRLIGAFGTTDDPNPVYVLWGDPNFVSDNCAGIDLSNDINPIEVGSSADRTQDAGTSLTLEIFATGGQTDPDFYGDQAIVYTPYVLCSNHQLFDAHVDNRALTKHACEEGTLSTLVVGTETLDACALTNSPIIGVVETAQIDIAINAELTGGFSVSHAFSSNLIFNALEPDAVRPAIERAAIPANGIILRATLSDGATNRSGSAIALNHVSNQLNQFATQLTFTPDPTFSTSRGIPDGANGVVIGTILPLEDELMEGDIDYPLLMAGATDYIVATRASTIRSQIHTQLPLVDNPLTDAPEQQAADYVFRMALDLDNPTVAAQVQNAVLPTMRVIDADDYFHYLVEGPAINPEILAGAVLNQFSEADAPVVNLRIGLGGTHIAWGGNNPTAIIGEAIVREMMVQVLSDAEFNAAAFLDSETPTHTDRSLFISMRSTADHQGAPRDVSIELPSSAVNIVPESNTALASYRSNQAWWQLRFGADIFAEGDEYIEIALSMREANPTNPAMPRALRRLGPASYLRYQINEPAPQMFVLAKSTAISSQQNRYPLPIISEYLASDVVAGEPSVHAIVSTLAVTTFFPQNGMVVQLDVYGHLANRDGDLILGTRAYATDETIPQSRLGDAVQIADTSVRRFYLQLGDRTPACLAESGITAQQVFETSAPVIGTNGTIEFPIGLGARRPSNKHASVHYGGTRVLRLSANIVCSDHPDFNANTPVSHVWNDPNVVNTTATDTRGIPVLLRDRADEFTLSYFVAATDSLPRAGFTPRAQLGLHEAGVTRPLPNTFARLYIHTALIPTSASFGDAPIIPISDLEVPIPISSLRTISTGICEGAEDCIPEPASANNNYYLGSIRAGIDANNTWEPNSQLQLIGAGTKHESSADFASEWLSPNPAIVSDPVQSTQMGRNALLLQSAPSALFGRRIFIAPAAILSSIAPQRIMLQDAQSYISVSASVAQFSSTEGIAGGLPVAEFELNLGGVLTQTPVEPLTALPSPLQIQLGFVFGFTTPTTNSSKDRPSFSIEGAGEQFIANSDSDARDPAMLTLTPTLGFDTGDSHTTSTLTIDNGHYFEASLTVSDDPSLTPEQQRRVVLRVVYNDAFDANLIRYGTLQARMVAPPADADYYIYPENDPIAPSAINLMIDNVDAPIIPCVAIGNTGNIQVSDLGLVDVQGPYPRDCLSARSRNAYAFSLDTIGLSFAVGYRSTTGILADTFVEPISFWEGALVRVHYYSPDDATTACDIPPESGPLPADSPYLRGRYAGSTVFMSTILTERNNRFFVVDTRTTGPAGAHYCVVLEAHAGNSATTLPVRVDLPDYSTDDDNNNGLPDDVEIIDAPSGLDPAFVYIQDYCRRVGAQYDPNLGARNDCDNDGVPDLAELQYGPPEDYHDYTLSRALCIAQGFYTRFPRADLGNLLCTDAAGDQAAATQTLAAIESDWMLAISGNDYAGVALEIASAGPPTTFRADNGLLPANRYWFVDPDERHMAEIFVAPALRFRVPSKIPSSRDGHRFIERAGADTTSVGPYTPMTIELLGNVPEAVAAIVNIALEGYDRDDLIATHSDEVQFTANSGLPQEIGTYHSSTLGFARNRSNPTLDFYATPRLSSVNAAINYAVCLDESNHPLHGMVLNDQRRAHERYEIGIARADLFDLSDNILPAGLQLLNAPNEDTLTAALPVSAATESTMDFILREHGILTQNAGVLYLGPHPNISTPTALSRADTRALNQVLRAQLAPSRAHLAELQNYRASTNPLPNISQSWSLLSLESGAGETVLRADQDFATPDNPYTLPDVATLCNMLPICRSATGGVDYARLLYTLYDLNNMRTVAMAQLWLQLGGDAAQIFDDADEDGVPETHGDTEGALSLPFSVLGARGSISVEQQLVALQLGFRARARYQTDPSFAGGANIGSGNILDLDFHLSCIDHAGQAGGPLFEADEDASVPSYNNLRDISGHLVDTTPTASVLRDDVYYDACLGYEVPVLIQLPDSMTIASSTGLPPNVVGFTLKNYSFSEGLPDGSCPQANARSDWWQPDGEAPRTGKERCMRLILEGNSEMAGFPTMPTTPIVIPIVVTVDPIDAGPYSGIGLVDAGSGGGAFSLAQLLLLLCLLVLGAVRAPKRRTSARAIS